MAELTVDYLSMVPHDDSSKSNHPKRQPVTSIIEWTQCFTHYVVILSKAKPERTPDLLGYQHLILEAHLEYSGDGWLVYDRRFRQIAATRPTTQWAQRDGDLWSMAFGSSQRKPYCLHCFGSAYRSEQCCGAPEATSREKSSYGPSEATFRANLVPTARPTYNPRPQKPKICWQWNLSHCTYSSCQYIHACLVCHGNPHLGNSNHKYINCPRGQNQSLGPPVHPLMRTPYPPPY